MSTLFRYLARQYFVNILTLLVILAALVVAVDVLINLDRFAGQARRIAGEDAGAVHHALLTGLLIVDLWGPRLLQLFTYLNGMVLIAAMGFTCVQLSKHREFSAMLAGGISLQRAALPIFAVGVGMLGAQLAVQELALPAVSHLLPREPGDAGERTLESFPLRVTPDGSGRLWYAAKFDDPSRALSDLVVWERDEDGKLVRTITAARATWDGTGWALEAGTARKQEQGAAPTPPVPVQRLETDLDPMRIKARSVQGYAPTLSSARLAELVRTPGLDERTRMRLELTRWGRYSGIASTFFALLGATALFLTRVPGAAIGSVLKASPLAFAGFAATAVASGAAIPGLPIWFGAFVPALVLLSIAVALLSGVET